MASENEHIRQFLNEYLKMESPEYAVLLKGKWGAGKTWFIDDYFKTAQSQGPASETYLETADANKKNHLYVSLYGVNSTSAIDDELFKQVHPILGGKHMQLVGSIAKTALKFSVNVDIDGDGKSDGSVKFNLPKERILEIAKKTRHMAIVFDDLERCMLPLPIVLGYINNYVEHGGAKVIILANTEEIDKVKKANKSENAESSEKNAKGEKNKDDGLRSDYLKIKEKLIGKEFEVAPNVEMAIAAFAKQLSENTKSKFNDHFGLVCEIYKQSGHNNLRLVRQGLLDFDRWTARLDPQLLENQEFYKQFLSLFCILFQEIGADDLKVSEIGKLFRWQMLGSFSGEKSEETQRLIAIAKKYSGIDLATSVVQNETWGKIISSGNVDIDSLNIEIKHSVYFKSDVSVPNWVKLWHYIDLSEEEYFATLIAVEKELESTDFDHLEIVMHVAGTLLHLSVESFYSRSLESIVSTAKAHMDRIYKRGNISAEDEGCRPRDTGWGGLGFHAIELDQFRELRKHADHIRAMVLGEQDNDEARNLLRVMKEDLREFTIALTLNSGGKYGTRAILHRVCPQTFFDSWRDLGKHDRRYVGYMIKTRYEYLHTFKDIHFEYEWLQVLRDICEKTVILQSTNFERDTYVTFGAEVKNAIENIERVLK